MKHIHMLFICFPFHMLHKHIYLLELLRTISIFVKIKQVRTWILKSKVYPAMASENNCGPLLP